MGKGIERLRYIQETIDSDWGEDRPGTDRDLGANYRRADYSVVSSAPKIASTADGATIIAAPSFNHTHHTRSVFTELDHVPFS